MQRSVRPSNGGEPVAEDGRLGCGRGRDGSPQSSRARRSRVFARGEGRIDETLGEINLATVAKILGEPLQ
jgi:hypothetical protein